MEIRRILRKLCMFLVGVNLIQPLRLFLDSSSYMFERFKVPLEEKGEYLSRGNLTMGMLSGIATMLVCFYLTLLSPKFGINHFNKLLTIITNWIVLVFDLMILIIFTIGGQGGYFSVFFWIVVASSFVFGINEAFLFIVDPINIPFFLLGVSCSAFEVVIYQLIYVASGTGESINNFKIVIGQIIISFVLSVLVVALCNYSYGGNTLFNLVGIHKICDFILDNSSKRLFDDYRKVSRYKKFLNEEIVNDIKNLEYEIILRFNIKSNYKITNIIKTRNKAKNKELNTSHENTNNTGDGNNNEAADESNREKVKIGVKVTSLKYENMLQGLEIYRHEVEKDVKLSRIKGEFTDIDVNLFHFKYADVYTKDRLSLINVVTVQFSSNNELANNVDTSFANSDPSETNDKHAHHSSHNRRSKYREPESSKESEVLGVYEMNYYFFVVHDRMYQYKPSEDEWVHPVELLVSVINLHKKSMQSQSVKHSEGLFKRVNGSFRRLYHKIIRSEKHKSPGNDGHYSDLNYNYDDELGRHNNRVNLEEVNKDEAHAASGTHGVAHGAEKGSGKREPSANSDRDPNTSDTSNGTSHQISANHVTINREAEEELDRSLRSKLVILFLNNKLRCAVRGSILPLLLNLVTIISLFMSFPMMGVYDSLETATSVRFEMVIKIVSIIPGVLICAVCTIDFLKNLSIQKAWHRAHNYVYFSYIMYVAASLVTLIATKRNDDIVSNNAFVLIMSLIIVVTFQINTITSFTSILFQKSSKLDLLTMNYLDNNIKTNVQLMSFNLFLHHLTRLIYLGVYKNYSNRLFKLLYWVI